MSPLEQKLLAEGYTHDATYQPGQVVNHPCVSGLTACMRMKLYQKDGRNPVFVVCPGEDDEQG